jgi:glycerol-3-phosphate O-acyltransferase
VLLVPTSIAYDQLHEVVEFAGEARGDVKQPENLAWLVRHVRAQRGQYGKIYVRFGEPVSLRQALGPPVGTVSADGNQDRLALQKLAFEVAWRMNQVTPITGTSLVTLTLLSARGRGLTLEQIHTALQDVLDFARRRGLPMTASASHLDTGHGVHAALMALARHKVVTSSDAGEGAVHLIGVDQHLAAAFYRNAIIHFFLNSAIAELALLRVADADQSDNLAAFWDEALELRDLLKFEFFFAEKEEFRQSLGAELDLIDAQWRERVRGGQEEIRYLLQGFRPLSAHTVLRSFLEAYGVVAEALERHPAAQEVDGRELLATCLTLGRRRLLQRRIQSPESVSSLLFDTGLQLARNRHLVEPAGDVAARRRTFARQIGDVKRRLDVVESIGLERFLTLIASRSG